MGQSESTTARTGERRRNRRSWSRDYSTGTAFAEAAKGRSSSDPILLEDGGGLTFMHRIQSEMASESNAILRPGALWDYIERTRQSA